MNGIYTLLIKSDKLSYKLELNRKITVIRGDSATGKTTFLSMLGMRAKALKIETSRPYIILDNIVWNIVLQNYNNHIILLDEEFSKLQSKEFAEAVKNSDNYFVIIFRFDLNMLPYSIDSVKIIRNSGKFNFIESKYKRKNGYTKSDLILTKDSKSGFQFFKNINKCISSNGNSNICSVLENILNNEINILICVDSAAFGPYINRLEMIISNNKYVKVFAPECFESMLLNSPMFTQIQDLSEKITNPENYIANYHFSWENYYVDLIEQITIGMESDYSKKTLSRCYVEDCCFTKRCKYYIKGDKIKMIFPDEIEILDFE